MRRGMLIGGLATLGLAAFTPGAVQAAHGPENRGGHVEQRRVEPVRHQEHHEFERGHDFDRHEGHRDFDRGHVEWEHRDVYVHRPVVIEPVVPVVPAPQYYDTPIVLSQVPSAVIQECDRVTNCAAIESADFIRDGGLCYYDLHVRYSNGACQTLRLNADGGFCGYR